MDILGIITLFGLIVHKRLRDYEYRRTLLLSLFAFLIELDIPVLIENGG
jgi:hypothetical protein